MEPCGSGISYDWLVPREAIYRGSLIPVGGGPFSLSRAIVYMNSDETQCSLRQKSGSHPNWGFGSGAAKLQVFFLQTEELP